MRKRKLNPQILLLDDVEQSLDSNEDTKKGSNGTGRDNEIQGNDIVDPISNQDEDNKIYSVYKDNKKASYQSFLRKFTIVGIK